MSCIALLCAPATGHLDPLIAVGRRLKQRGHVVTVFQIADAEAAVLNAGLNFTKIGIHDAPLGSMRRWDEELSELKGLRAFRRLIDHIRSNARRMLCDAPAAMRAAKIQAVVGDGAEAACGSVAEHLCIPFVTLQFSAPIVYDNSLPPVIFRWKHRSGALARLRNRIGYKIFFSLALPVLKEVNSTRIQWGLRPLPSFDWSSTLMEISQLPRALEFLGVPKHHRLRYTGPFQDANGRRSVEFPWRLLNGKSLVYTSMGTVFNGIDRVFRTIAEACLAFDVQLVMTLGGNLDPNQVGALPGSPLVVRYAPQLELLRRAAVTITHAGMNTTLESLAQGVPLVAIPVAADQPGVAARIAASKTGVVVPLRRISVHRLRAAIGQVLENPIYRDAARRMQMQIKQYDGIGDAVDLIETGLGLSHHAGLNSEERMAD